MPLESSTSTSTNGSPVFLRPRRSRVLYALAVVIFLFFFTSLFSVSSAERRARTKELWHKGISIISDTPEELHYIRNVLNPGTVIKPPKDRLVDVSDSFDDFYRLPGCYINSLSLHEPFHPLCINQGYLMEAMTDGGRAGMDAPYIPKGCDMRWFNSDEICEIMSRFDKVHVIGDSMMRNLATAMHVYLRKNLVYGPRAQWMPEPEGYDCTCTGTFSLQHCIWVSAFSSEAIWEHDPQSMACPRNNTALVEFNPHLNYPLNEGVPDMVKALPDFRPPKPHVFLYGHGIWNNLSIDATKNWTYELLNGTVKKNPWLQEPGAVFPKLFVTPNAAGELKPAEYQEAQGNPALSRFEKAIRGWVPEIGAQHLGVYNLTIQSTSPDGTHAGMRSNLVKAMMVFNWMNSIDVSGYTNGGAANG